MKKVAFISLLGIVTLLSTCSSSNIRVKQPKFEEEGNRISYVDFTTALENAAKNSDINQEAAFKSKEGKFSVQSQGENLKSTIKYDPKNMAFMTKTETTNVVESESEITKTNDVVTVKSEAGTGITTIDEKLTSVNFNNNTIIITFSGTFYEE